MSILGEQNKVTTAPGSPTSIGLVDSSAVHGRASENEASKQMEQSIQEEEARALVTDLDPIKLAFSADHLCDLHPEHSYLTCKRALELTQLRMNDAIDLLSCETFVPKIDIASGPDLEPPSDHELAAMESFPFMKLPQEVRSMVYKEYLILPGSISTVGFAWADAASSTKLRRDCILHQPAHHSYVAMDRSVFGLWSVSKALRKESVSLFFRHNDFRFANLNQLQRFLSHISVEGRRSIASIYVGYFGAAPARTFKLLRECVGLRRLTLELQQMSIGTVPWIVKLQRYKLMKIHGLADLLKIRGLQIVKVESGGLNESVFIREFDDELVTFKEALQVLKQPHNPAQLRRQEKKDYPHGVGRTLFGKANVTTRMEKKVMGTQLV